MKGTSAYNPRQVPDGQIISIRSIFDQRFWFCEDAGLFQKIRQRLNQRIRDTFPFRVPGNVHGSPMRTVNNAPSGPVLRGNEPHKRWLAKRAASIRVSSPILPIQFEISIMRHAMPNYDSATASCLSRIGSSTVLLSVSYWLPASFALTSSRLVRISAADIFPSFRA